MRAENSIQNACKSGLLFLHTRQLEMLGPMLVGDARMGKLINSCPHDISSPSHTSRWKQQSTADHQDHMRRVAFRGILEAVTGGEDTALHFSAVNDLR